MPTIEHDEVCERCEGTGLYQGMGERDGFAVVCHQCKGTGRYHYVHQYEPFVKRVTKQGVLRVLQANLGVIAGTIGRDRIFPIDHFGGLPFEDWEQGKPFVSGTEMRCASCPVQWFQIVDYDRKPEWDECGFGSFESCKHYNSKELCWKRFDLEQEKKGE